MTLVMLWLEKKRKKRKEKDALLYTAADDCWITLREQMRPVASEHTETDTDTKNMLVQWSVHHHQHYHCPRAHSCPPLTRKNVAVKS